MGTAECNIRESFWSRAKQGREGRFAAVTSSQKQSTFCRKFSSETTWNNYIFFLRALSGAALSYLRLQLATGR